MSMRLRNWGLAKYTLILPSNVEGVFNAFHLHRSSDTNLVKIEPNLVVH